MDLLVHENECVFNSFSPAWIYGSATHGPLVGERAGGVSVAA